MSVGAPLTLPMNDISPLILEHVHLTKKGAKCTYSIPFECDGLKAQSIIMRVPQIEKEFQNRPGKIPTQEVITQGKYECGPAAIAMATGHTLFNAKRAAAQFGWCNDNRGIAGEKSHGAFRALGYEMLYVREHIIYELRLKEIPICVLTVPSLNLKGRYHAVTWMNGEILDPNVGRPGRLTYGREWNPHTIGAVGAELMLKPMSRIDYEDIRTLYLRDQRDELKEVIKECAA